MANRILVATLLFVFTGCQSTQSPPFETHGRTGASAVPDFSATPQFAERPTAKADDGQGEFTGIQTSRESASEIHPVGYVQEDVETPITAAHLELPSPTPETTSEMSLEHLEQIALANHPSLARAEAQLQALRGKWLQAGLPPNPTLGYVSEEMGDAGTAGKQGGFVGQELITGGKLDLDRAVVSQEILRAEQILAAQQQRVLTDVRSGYYDVLIAQRKLDLTRELVKVSTEAVDTSERLLEAREIPRVGLLQTQIEARNARILLRRARNDNIASWRRLTSVLGEREMSPQRIEGSLEQVANDLDWGEQLERLMTQSPEIAAAVAQLDRACFALDRAHAEVIPDLNVQISVQHDNASDETVTGVQVGLPIPIWNKNQGGIRQAFNETVAARRNIERVELDLRRRLAEAFQTYADSRYEADNFSREILPKAAETFHLVTNGYQQGEVGYLDLLAAQRTYFETNLSYIESLRGLWRATMQIDGMLLDNSLEEGQNP